MDILLHKIRDRNDMAAVLQHCTISVIDSLCHFLMIHDQIMDSVAHTRKKTIEGQMGMFDFLEQDAPASSIPIPDLAEMNKVDLMQLEKETTGIYLSGHPMDDYRPYLRNTHVVQMGKLMDEESHFEDDQIVSVAGIVQNVKMKTTRNNSMMAYVEEHAFDGSGKQ